MAKHVILKVFHPVPPQTMTRHLPPPFLIAALLVTFAGFTSFTGFAMADTIQLKSGEVLKGSITAEDTTAVQLEFEASRGIRDERRILKSDILKIQKDDPSQKAWSEITKKLPVQDLAAATDYDRLIARTESFLRDNPDSPFKNEAKRLVDSLRAERGRVTAGDMKLGGQWISVDQYQREKFWVDGAIALRKIVQSSQSGRLTEALRQYELVEATYSGTTIHAKAITEIKPILRKYAASIDDAILSHPQLLKLRDARLATLEPIEREATVAAQKAEEEAYLKKVEEERKSGTKWLSIDTLNLDELKKAKETAAMEAARIAAVDTTGADVREALLRQIDQAIGEGRLKSASDLILEASTSLKDSPHLKALTERVKNEIARISEDKAAAEAARIEAEKRSKAAIPPPIKSSSTRDEQDKLEEEMLSPVAKAVRESQLGKRVAKNGTATDATEPETPPATEPTSPQTTPKETTPPAKPSQPETTTPSGPAAKPAENTGTTPQATPLTSPEPPALTSPASTDDTPPPPKKQNSSSGLLNTVLYILAGILVLALLALLVYPLFKKKKTDNDKEPAARC